MRQGQRKKRRRIFLEGEERKKPLAIPKPHRGRCGRTHGPAGRPSQCPALFPFSAAPGAREGGRSRRRPHSVHRRKALRRGPETRKGRRQARHARRRRGVVRAVQDHGQDDLFRPHARGLVEENRHPGARRRGERRGAAHRGAVPGLFVPHHTFPRRGRKRDRPHRGRLRGERFPARRRRHPRAKDAAARGPHEAQGVVERRRGARDRERAHGAARPPAPQAHRASPRERGGRPEPAGNPPALHAARGHRDGAERPILRDVRSHRDLSSPARDGSAARVLRGGARDRSREAGRRRVGAHRDAGDASRRSASPPRPRPTSWLRSAPPSARPATARRRSPLFSALLRSPRKTAPPGGRASSGSSTSPKPSPRAEGWPRRRSPISRRSRSGLSRRSSPHVRPTLRSR